MGTTAIATRVTAAEPSDTPRPSVPWALRAWVMLAVAVPVAALTLLVSRSPTYDVWAWLVWGREVAHLDLSTVLGPAWKPLPVFTATLLTPAGPAMPALWLVVARVGGLLAVGLLTVNLWLGYLLPYGMTEPMMAGFVLWALDRHVDGRRGSAFWLLVGAALLRPEIWPFLIGYALWLWRGRSVPLAVLAGGLALVPLAWFVPQWFGSHHPFRLGGGQAAPNGPLTHANPGLASLEQLNDDLVLWVKIGAVAGAIYAVAARDRLMLTVLGGGVVWAAIVGVMAQARVSSGVSRYLVVTHAAAAVLAGVGWVKLIVYARDWLVARADGRGRGWAWIPGVAAALVVAVLSLVSFGRQLRPLTHEVRHQESVYEALPKAVDAAGGRGAILACGKPWVDPLQVTFVAWELHIHAAAVRSNPLPGPAPSTFIGPMLQTRNRVHDPVSPEPFTFLTWTKMGDAKVGGVTWTVLNSCS